MPMPMPGCIYVLDAPGKFASIFQPVASIFYVNFQSGPLRERLSAILRADCIVINGDKNLEFENKIKKYLKKKTYKYFTQNIKLKIQKNYKIKR